MYSKRVTAQMIEAVNRQRETPLIYHTVNEIDAAIAHFNDLLDPDTSTLDTRRRPAGLTKEESAFISNERLLCALDYRYWVQMYGWIITFEKKPARFTPNIAQNIVIDVWGEFEEQARAIHLQQNKARRLGVSTVSELAVQHRFQFHPYSNCVVASADPGKSVLMADMIDFCLEQQPWWLLPQVTKRQKNMPAEFGDIHTALTIQAGNQFNGVARGATPSVVHLSELAEWVDPESLVDAALYRAIIDTPDVFCVLESTSEGRGNWWHRTWEQNKRDWARGRGRVRPIFLPWYVGTDLYPPAQDLRVRPAPQKWIPTDRTIKHAERARDYVLHNDLLFTYLAKNDADWQMPREQMWWYECEYEAARDKKELNIFLSELPSDDHECFQSNKITIIDTEIVQAYREEAKEPWGAFTILGPDIPLSLTVPKRFWDFERTPIDIRTAQLLRFNATYRLQPIKWRGYQDATSDPNLKFFVWEPPEDGSIFGVGVDTSDGVGANNSAIEVVRQGELGEGPAQCAEFVSPYIKAFQLWPMMLAVSCWYSTWNPKAERRTHCRVAIECRGNGESAQFELKKRGWTNFHPWKRYDGKKRTPDSKVHKEGVFTMDWWRSQMLDYLLTLIDEMALTVRSPWFVDEMASLERDYDSQKMKAAYGEMDDRIMALGFILFSMDVERIRGPRYNPRRPVSMDIPKPDSTQVMTGMYPVWQAPIQSRSTAVPMTYPVRRDHRGRLGLGTLRPRSGGGW